MKDKNDVVNRLRKRFDDKPWHYRLKVKLMVKWWTWKLNMRHYWNWCTSEMYRIRYNKCTFYCDACHTHNWAEEDAYCRNNLKCIVKYDKRVHRKNV